MGWRTRATPVTDAPKKSSWRDRAKPVEATQPEATESVALARARTRLAGGQHPDKFTTEDINPGIVRRTVDYFTPKERRPDSEDYSAVGSVAKGYERAFRPGDATTFEPSLEEREARPAKVPLGLAGKVDAANYRETPARPAAEIVAEDEREAEDAYRSNPLSYTVGNMLSFASPGPKARAMAAGPLEAAATKGGKALGELAETAQRKALNYSAADTRKAGVANLNRQARTILDEAKPGLLDSPGKLLDRVEDASAPIGQRIGDVRRDLTSKGVMGSLQDLVDKIDAIDVGNRSDDFGEVLYRELEKGVRSGEKYAADGAIPMDQLAAFKNRYKDVFKRYGRAGVQDVEGKGGVARDIYGAAREVEDDVFKKYAPEAMGDKRKYGQLEGAADQLNKLESKEESEQFLGLRDMLGKILFRRAPQAAAVGSDKVSKILTSKWAPFLKAAADGYGPNGMMVAHNILLEKDPEYRAAVESSGTE